MPSLFPFGDEEMEGTKCREQDPKFVFSFPGIVSRDSPNKDSYTAFQNNLPRPSLCVALPQGARSTKIRIL